MKIENYTAYITAVINGAGRALNLCEVAKSV